MLLADGRGVDWKAFLPGQQQGGFWRRVVCHLPGSQGVGGQGPVGKEIHDLPRLSGSHPARINGRAGPGPAVGEGHHRGVRAGHVQQQLNLDLLGSSKPGSLGK